MSGNTVPTGWAIVRLFEVCDKITDGSHNPPKPAGSGGLPMLSAKNIQAGKIDFDLEHRLIPEHSFELEHQRTRVSANDVVLTIVGALGRTALVPTSAPKFTLQRSVAVLAAPRLVPEFFRYALDAPDFQRQILQNAKGTAQKGIYLNVLSDREIYLPPLAEQKQIAAKLDELLAQVDTLKARLDAIPAILKRFRQSVLAAAVSGRLTEDWREQNEQTSVEDLLQEIAIDGAHSKKSCVERPHPLFDGIPPSWRWVAVSDIAEADKNALKAGPFGSALKKSEYTESGYRVYGQEQVIAGDESLVTYYVSGDKYAELQACAVKPGDILISLVGTIGKVLVLSDLSAPGIINPRLVKMSLHNAISREYVRCS